MATLEMDTVCGHVNKVTASNEGASTRVIIETTCPHVQKWGTEFLIPAEDIADINNKTFSENGKKIQLMPTCFVPTLVMNVVWMENGLLSKNLVKSKSPVQIQYKE